MATQRKIDDVLVTAETMQRWEYLVRENLTEAQLNALGKQGWRLIGPPTSRTSFGTSGALIYVCERPG